ncbi:MAG TPA: ankyrin repeat domain-containing protein [Methylophilaceae bacterium]|nr:ankyrin repeat domain-containing protein [Methylophilaceae bacterium]
MKMIKVLLLAVTMTMSLSAFALTDDEHVKYTEALRDGNVKVVKKFLDHGVDVNEKFFAWEALQIAANKNQMAVVKLLVEKGADLNYQHPMTKMTAMHFAAYNNNKDMVAYLISKGADKNLKLRNNVSIIRALKDENMTDMVNYLLGQGVVEDGCTEGKCE